MINQEKLTKLKRDYKDETWELGKYEFIAKVGSALGLGIGAAVTFLGGLLANSAENKARKAEYIEAHLPEVEAKTEEIKAQLHEKYPVLDTSNLDYTNIEDVMRDAYYNCFHKISGGAFSEDVITIKDGWTDYYVDYANRNLGWVKEEMDSVTNGYDHASITDSILTSLPSGVGSMAVICAAAIIPLAIHKAKMHSMQKEINELEASMGKDN